MFLSLQRVGRSLAGLAGEPFTFTLAGQRVEIEISDKTVLNKSETSLVNFPSPTN